MTMGWNLCNIVTQNVNQANQNLNHLCFACYAHNQLLTFDVKCFSAFVRALEFILKALTIHLLLQATKKREDELDAMKASAEKRLHEVKEESLEVRWHRRIGLHSDPADLLDFHMSFL